MPNLSRKASATACAVLAAALYAVNIPLSKALLAHIAPAMMAALLYLGAGLGIAAYSLAARLLRQGSGAPRLTRKELPDTAAMVLLDIAAPILLMLGVARTNSANVSLLNNFEIVATSVIALALFREVISRRLWAAIVLMTAASILLSFEGAQGLTLNGGSLLVLGACVCWGFENNATRRLSTKSSREIVIVKGLFSGLGSLGIALALKEPLPGLPYLLAALALGFVSYGMSINFYVMAQKELGAAKTSAYYSIAPFLGVAFSMLLLGERPGPQFYIALFVMLASTVLMVKDTVSLQHTHVHTHVHTHPHRHGDTVHTHPHTHEHTHSHIHGQDPDAHTHTHGDLPEHTHIHGETLPGGTQTH